MNTPVAWCLSYLFNKYLSSFLREMNSEQVLFSMLKGDIQLGNLELCPQDLKDSSIRLVQGYIKSFKLSIPWPKVLMGESCVIKMEISELYLELTKSTKINDSNEDQQELKSGLLEDFEAGIKDKRNSFKKLFDMMSSKFLSIEIVEFILSRLEISISGIQVNFTHSGGKDLVLSISSLKILPTDDNFQEFPEASVSLWDKLNSFRPYTFAKPNVTLSNSLLQFKLITLSSIEISIKSSQKFVLLDLKQICLNYSSKNFLWLGESKKNTDILIKSTISEVNFYLNDEMIKVLLQILELRGRKVNRTAKEMWGIAREAIFKKVRMRSWWYVTKKVLWKSVYQKLYAKYSLGLEPEPSVHQAEPANLPKPASVPATGLTKYIQMILPEPEYQPAPKESPKKRPKSSIVPAFHFNSSCPVDKLEKALMADLEKNLDISEIIEYRMEEQERYDYREFEKAMMKNDVSNSGFSQIYNYFQAKGGIIIKQSDNNKKVELLAQVDLQHVSLKLFVKHKVYVSVGIYEVSVTEKCLFNQPIFRRKHFNYDRTSFATILIKKLEVHDLMLASSKVLQPILTFEGGMSLEITDNLKNEYIKSNFNEIVLKKLSVSLPHLVIFLVPSLVLGIKSFVLDFFPPKLLTHLKEDSLLDMLESNQRVHINPRRDLPLTVAVNIQKIKLFVAASYEPNAAVLNFNLDGICCRHSSSKAVVDICCVDLVAATMGQLSSVSSLFLPRLLSTHSVRLSSAEIKHEKTSVERKTEIQFRMTTVERRTEILFKMVQMDLARAEIEHLFQVVQAWGAVTSTDMIPEQVITIPLQEGLEELVLHKVLASVMIQVNSIYAAVRIQEVLVKVMVKHVVYSGVTYLLENMGCASAREVNAVNTSNQQVLLHMFSETPPNSVLLMPGTNAFHRDPHAAFYLIHQSIEKSNSRYINILSTVEFTFGNFNLSIDLRLLAFVLDLNNSLGSQNKIVPRKETALVILSKFIVHGTNFTVLFLDKERPNYMLVCSKMCAVLDNYSNKTQLRLRISEPRFVDISMESSSHSQILSPNSEDSVFELNYVSRTIEKSRSSESVIELKISNSKITFLNRAIMELVDFMHKDLLGVFSSDSDPSKGTTAICILLTGSELFLPRNSVTHDGFFITFPCFKLVNSMDTYLSNNLCFKSEKDLEDKKSKLITGKNKMSVYNRVSFKMLTKGNRTMMSGRSEPKHLSMDIDPEEIKHRENVVELDGFEIFYYDPDEDNYLLEIHRSPIIASLRHNIHEKISEEDLSDEENPEEQDSVSQEKINSPFTSLPTSPKVRDEGIKTDSDPSLDSERTDFLEVNGENCYLVLITGCQMLDYARNEITLEPFDIRLKLEIAEKPMIVNLTNDGDSLKLVLFQDQYNIIIKSLQENFAEITRKTELIPEESTDIWLVIEVTLKDIVLQIFNSPLEYLMKQGHLKSKIEMVSQLCEITLENFSANVEMSENGRKVIELKADNFTVDDSRLGSEFNIESYPPLLYTFSTKHLGGYYRSCSGLSANNSEQATPHYNYRPSFVNNFSDLDTPHLSILIIIDQGKKIQIDYNYAILVILADFLSDLAFFFQCPFNPDLFKHPENVKFIQDPNPPDMAVQVIMSKVHIILPSALSSIDKACLLLRLADLNIEITWKGDCAVGPGTMEAKLVINLESGHIVPVRYGLEFSDRNYYDPVIEPYSLKIDYLSSKPTREACLVTSQMNVRSSKDKDFNTSLTFTCIATLKQVFALLGEVPARQKNDFKCSALQPKLEVSSDISPSNNQISMNLALYGVSVKFLNDQMQPIFLANISELLCAYQHAQSIKDIAATFIILMEVDYFNQKLMAWEPMIEMWGLELQYSFTQGISHINISEYSNALQINVSAALLTSVSDILPVLTNLAENSDNQQMVEEPYKFQNETGLPIKIFIKQSQWTQCIEQEIEDKGSFALRMEEINNMNLTSNARANNMNYDKKTLSIEINPSDGMFRHRVFSQLRFRPVHNIGIDTPDTYFISLEMIGDRHENLALSKKFTKKRKQSEDESGQSIEDINCCAFLRPRKKYENRLVKEKVKSNSEKDHHSKVSFLVDVQWDQEVGQRVVNIRSSISVVNTLPTGLTVVFSQNDYQEDTTRNILLEANQQIPVPLLVASKGKINLRPSDDYEDSKVITHVNNSVQTTDSLIVSGTDGIVNKDLLSVVEFKNKGDIGLGFIALCCDPKKDKSNRRFYCAITVKKIENANPVRRVEQVKTQANSQGKGLIGYKNKIAKQVANEIQNQPYEEENFNLESTSDETMLVISSIVSFTNALSKQCKTKIWTEEEPDEYSTLSQGETEHLYFLEFFKDKIYIAISIAGYDFCYPVAICLLNINKEQKFCIEMVKSKQDEIKEKRTSNLFLWIHAIEDENNCWRLSLYSPYWIINKSDLHLIYGEPRSLGKKRYSQEEEIGHDDLEVVDNSIDIQAPFSSSLPHYSKVSILSTKRGRVTRDDFRKLTEIFKGFKTQKEVTPMDPKGWSKISLFSTSKIINKLNVAVDMDEKVSKWSQNFSLTNSGTSGELRIEGYDGIQYDLGVTIEKGQGAFQLVNIITFHPLYILKNNYNRELLVKQIDVDKRKAYWNLPPNTEKPIYWYISKVEKSLSVAVNLGEGHEITKKWSGGFSISELGEFIIRLPIDHIDGQAEENFLQVSVISSDPMIIIQFSSANKRVPTNSSTTPRTKSSTSRCCP